MKKFILLLTIISTVSCDKQSNSSNKIGNDYTIRIIDGCEYIECEYGYRGTQSYSYTLTHKGNCKNANHKCKCNGD